jgi:hypothetical protein
VQELQVSRATAREHARSSLACEDFVSYFMDIVDALSKYVFPKQILNMDESGVTARPFKGKKQK